MRAVAEARTNIALVKYWGKSDPALNLPAVASLSLTLDGLHTRTEVSFAPHADQDLPTSRESRSGSAVAGRESRSGSAVEVRESRSGSAVDDELWLNDQRQQGVALQRVTRHLDRVLASTGAPRPSAVVRSYNNFPTAAGLASSASAFAALTVAAAAAAGLSLSAERMAILARQGSGSAARSLFGGLVLLGAGTPGQEDSAQATPLLAPEAWPELRMVIGVATEEQKDTPSTDGMVHTAATSPYYGPWVAGAPGDIREALQAVRARDLEALGLVAERSALRMHASALAADPGVCYLRGATIEGLHAIRRLRRGGVPVFFTCDAGPHPKALTTAAYAEQVAAALQAVPGVLRTLTAGPGAAARVLGERGGVQA